MVNFLFLNKLLPNLLVPVSDALHCGVRGEPEGAEGRRCGWTASPPQLSEDAQRVVVQLGPQQVLSQRGGQTPLTVRHLEIKKQTNLFNVVQQTH